MMAFANLKREQTQILEHAVQHSAPVLNKTRNFWDKLFVKAFEGLVYPQIWEDPESDMLALNLDEKSRIVCIASGGCNILSYLTKSPEKIDAVDLNRHHVALNKLKLSAIRYLPSYELFFTMFGYADKKENIGNYNRYICQHLDLVTRSYWSGRNFGGERRIAAFQKGFYKFGLLGKLIGIVHAVSNSYGKSPRKAFLQILQAKTQDERQAIFDREIGVMFDKKLVRWFGKMPASLYGLGIPPAQYDALLNAGKGDVMATLRDRTEKLAIGFSPEENYFAWQAFLRKYDTEYCGAVPTYLKPNSFDILKKNVNAVDIHHGNIIDFLASLPDADRTAYLFLDAQDWMTPAVLAKLWTEVTRTARTGARVVFRTADFESPLEAALPPEILNQWIYDEDLSRIVIDADRSAIYGAAHVYIKKGM